MIDLPRLYAVLDTEAIAQRGLAPLDVLAAWLDAGIRCVQLRAKTLPSGAFVDLALAVIVSAVRAGLRIEGFGDRLFRSRLHQCNRHLTLPCR